MAKANIAVNTCFFILDLSELDSVEAAGTRRKRTGPAGTGGCGQFYRIANRRRAELCEFGPRA
jgi:hypothetical protein